MLLKITETRFLEVPEDFYDPEVLSGEGTLAEQICEYEKIRVERDEAYTRNMRRGEVKVEEVPVRAGFCGDSVKHSKHKITGDDTVRLMCYGVPVERLPELKPFARMLYGETENIREQEDEKESLHNSEGDEASRTETASEVHQQQDNSVVSD